MQKLIEVRTLYVNTGTGKNGKPYRLLKVLANDSCYYTTFDRKLEPILKEGNTLKVECEKGTKEGSFNLKGAELYSDKADVPETLISEKTQGKKAEYVSSPLPLPLSDEDIEQAMKKAMKLVSNTMGVREDELNPDNELLARAFNAYIAKQEQRFAIELSRHIQQNKLANMGMLK